MKRAKDLLLWFLIGFTITTICSTLSHGAEPEIIVHREESEWSVMICDAEGCDKRVATSKDGLTFLVSDTDLNVERAKRCTITIVNGDKRRSGRFVSHDIRGAVFALSATSPTQYAVKLSGPKRSALASGVNTRHGIVTCAHVVEGIAEFTAECDGETAQAKVAKVDKKHDLALLSVVWKQRHDLADLSESDPKKGDGLVSVGRQKDGTITADEHSLVGDQWDEYQYSNPPCEGRSGSGVFNESGELIGIVTGKLVDAEPYLGRAATRDAIVGLLPRAVASGRMLCRVHMASWCIPCKQQKDANGDGDERIQFEYTTDKPPVDVYPCTTFTDSAGAVRYIAGYHTTEQIWQRIQRTNAALKEAK